LDIVSILWTFSQFDAWRFERVFGVGNDQAIEEEESVRSLLKVGLAILGAIAVSAVGVTGALAQSTYSWTPKPKKLAKYENGHVPHTKLTNVLAGKNPSKSWTHKVVDDKHLRAGWVGLKVGDATRPLRVTDHQTAFIVWDGQIEVTIEGVAPFVATKGYMIRVPFRRLYSLKNVGDTTVAALWNLECRLHIPLPAGLRNSAQATEDQRQGSDVVPEPT
jgi:glyoxylate utilization-related uncharacterized protein